jgi:hypothetical protein
MAMLVAVDDDVRDGYENLLTDTAVVAHSSCRIQTFLAKVDPSMTFFFPLA